MRRSRIILLSSVLALCFAAPASATNILSNPDFETGSLSPWTQLGSDWAVTTTGPHNGTYAATVTGSFELRQDFAPVPTSSITSISFQAQSPLIMGYFFYYSDSTIDMSNAVLFDGSSILQGFDVVGQLAPGKLLTGISFFGASSISASTTYLDDVVVNSAIPEPATLAPLAFGLVALGCARRRRSAA